jgi:abortive infection bacteriophage resistance protein
MRYTKQTLTLAEQIRTLQTRGLIIENEADATIVLEHISYFRLADYWRPLETGKVSHQFALGSSFSEVVTCYNFDNEMKVLLFSAIQTIEVAVRAKVIKHFSKTSGPFWFMEASNAINSGHFQSNLARVRTEVARSKESYIKEHFLKYDEPDLPPVWKTLEVVSLGTLSKLISNFSDNNAKNQVAADFRLPQFLVLESWLESLTALRNYIAHHARIWNRRFPQKPELLRRSRYPWITTNPRQPFKLYSILCCIVYWLNAIDDEKNTFVSDFKALLMKYPTINPVMMGFPHSWSVEPLWK